MFTNETITKNVRELLKKYDTRDPFRIAARLGIEVLYTDTLSRLKGMYRVIKRNRFIILNNKNSPKMNRIVCAHELGHDRLHREYATDRTLKEFMLYDMSTRQEYEANVFAAALLLDDETVLEYIEQGLDTEQIALATETDINLVALKVDCLIRDGHHLRMQGHNSKFLK
ncbi:MAG: ImmA/IrrE family metallo-endopeptidase [Clostridia bacterium]|nr:ImmA/IrrE family metallo-endopeptidase [Clostridia bacterium]